MATVEEVYSVAVRDRASGELGRSFEVRLYDRDRSPDQHLRSAATDGQGQFRLW